MDIKDIIENEINTQKNINNNYKNTSFFHKTNLNKSIIELKGILESKKKLISGLDSRTGVKIDTSKTKKPEMTLLNFNSNSKTSRLSEGKPAVMRSSSMSDLSNFQEKQNNSRMNKNGDSISDITQNVRNSSISYRDNISLFNLKQLKDEPSKIDFVFKRIFDRKLYFKLNPVHKKTVYKRELEDEEYRIEQEIKRKIILESKSNNYIQEKIKSIKNKIYFMKGVLDFSYPPIMISKFKQISEGNVNEASNNKKNSMMSSIDPDKNFVHSYTNLKNMMAENSRKRNESLKKSFIVDNLTNDNSIKNNFDFKYHTFNLKKTYSTSNLHKTSLTRFNTTRLHRKNKSTLIDKNQSIQSVKVINPLIINSFADDQIP